MAGALSVAGDAGAVPQVAPLRLLWLIDSLTLGGAESLAVAFARESRRRGLELTVCARTSIGGNPLEKEIRAAGVDVVTLGARNLRDREAFRRLLALIRERHFDVIHAHLTYAAIWGAVAARITRVPLVATLHVQPARRTEWRETVRQRLLTFLLNRYAARTLLVSEWLERAWGKRLKRTTVVRNGIDVREIAAPNARYEFSMPYDALVVTSVAVLREGKGIDVLLHAAANLATRSAPETKFILLIVGEGPMRDAWRNLALDLGVPVIWTGYRRDVRTLLAASDLFVLPTLADALPTVLLEAMAEGVPVIASDVGGVPEIVDETTGMLVPPADVRALEEALDRALRDEPWRGEAGRAARTKVESQFSVDVWTDHLLEIYAEVRRR